MSPTLVHGSVITLLLMVSLSDDSYSFTELLADMRALSFKDGLVGDVVAEVLSSDGNGHGLYKTVSLICY